ncbi:MAG: peptidase S10 [Bacteroidetes bacterium]|nr:MAG: peptidase S10 [Bacteroidota bacterium]
MKRISFILLAFFTIHELHAQKANLTSEKTELTAVPGQTSITKNSVLISGHKIDYTATAGYAEMKNDTGKLIAKIFFTYYKKDEEGAARRPITFAFNGGPGSSSVWLHLGALGPRRVVLSDDGTAVGPPYQYINNEFSWLDKTDIVFIDPVSTGFSSPASGVNANQFHGYVEDLQSVASFIRYFLSKNERWSSSKFLAGESYGTTRAAGLADYLQSEYRIFLNGIFLISAVLNFGTNDYYVGNDLPAILYLPSFTAAAWYHRKLSPELQTDLNSALKASEQFAMNELAPALLKGELLTDEENNTIAEKMSRLTGLSKEFCLQNNLRITDNRFYKELRRKDGLTIGRLDARFTGKDFDNAGEGPDYDPSFVNIDGPFTAMINEYLQKELHFKEDKPYNIFGNVHPWNFNNVQNRFLNVAENLRSAMTKNPSLKVYVGAGYYDFATPYFIAHYDVTHMFLRPELRDHIQFHYYQAGHMYYINKPSLIQFKKDVDEFFDKNK